MPSVFWPPAKSLRYHGQYGVLTQENALGGAGRARLQWHQSVNRSHHALPYLTVY
ncbi:Uncharacterised protein [Vibrio cholerae]|nr:Uncharacterised protein [Vibrio cholerae]